MDEHVASTKPIDDVSSRHLDQFLDTVDLTMPIEIEEQSLLHADESVDSVSVIDFCLESRVARLTVEQEVSDARRRTPEPGRRTG